MTWGDAIRLAARSVSRRLGRAALTVLAVAMAAALLSGLVIIATTARTRVLSQLSKGGPLASIRVEGNDLGSGDLGRIRAMRDVDSAVPVQVTRELIVPPIPPVYSPAAKGADPPADPPSDPFVDGVVGVDLSRADLFPLSVVAGRLPRAGSQTEVAVTEGYLRHVGLDPKRPVPVLGTELEMADARFPNGSFDDGAFARWTRATVVGVVAQDAAAGDIVAPIQQVQRSVAFSRDSAAFAAILVDARTLDQVGPVRDALESMGYSASAPENFIATVQRYLHVVEIVLTAIGIIALVIAAIGITDALLAAVRERRREIGVLKAIGARDRDVLRVFLVEAAMVGFVGGLLGVVTGFLIARTVAAVVDRYMVQQGLAGIHLGSPWGVVVGGLVVSVLLSLIAGAAPALRAARLPAREAMGSS